MNQQTSWDLKSWEKNGFFNARMLKTPAPPKKKTRLFCFAFRFLFLLILDFAFSWRWKHVQILQSNPLRLEKIDFKVANQITNRIQIRPWWFSEWSTLQKQQRLKQLNFPAISPLLSSVCSQHFEWMVWKLRVFMSGSYLHPVKKARFYHATFLSFLEFLPPSQIANKLLAGWLDGQLGDHEWWPCDASVHGSAYWCVRTLFRDTTCRIESRLPNLLWMEALCTLLVELPPWPSRMTLRPWMIKCWHEQMQDVLSLSLLRLCLCSEAGNCCRLSSWGESPGTSFPTLSMSHGHMLSIEWARHGLKTCWPAPP